MSFRRNIIMPFLAIAFFIAIPFVQSDPLKYESKGKRDPFVPLIGPGKTITAGLEDILSIEDVNLEGIAVAAKGNRVAIINGQILKENDKVGSVLINKITDKAVTLSIDGKAYNINLPEEGGTKGER